MKKAFAFTLATAMTLALSAYAEDKPDAAASSKDFIMLKVDGDGVKKSEIDESWKMIFQGRETPAMDSFGPKMKEKFLREVASEHVLYKEAEKQGIENSQEVKDTLEKVKKQIIIQQLLKEKTKDAVTDDKLKAVYEAHLKESSKDPAGGEELHARHILVKTKEEAEDIEKKLKKGGDFEKLAKEKSEDKSSGTSGGDLGWFTADKMVPEFSKALLKLKKGEISAPVKTDFGWHVIQLEDRRKQTPPTFEEVKDTLKQEAGGKAVSEYVKGLMGSVKITAVDAQGHETDVPAVSADKDVNTASPAAGKAPAE